MMERKNPIDNALQAKAEADFAKMVAKAIEINPSVITKPQKYEVGSLVYIKGMEEVCEIEKSDAGVYLLKLKNGKPALCLEGGLSLVN